LVVLELAGHGLSGNIAGLGRATCPNFDDLVNHVIEFTKEMSGKFSRSKGFAVCGCSLGGALIAYAVQGILSATRSNNIAGSNTKQNECPDFYGIALLAPSLGVNPGAIPPSPVVAALKALSFLVPSKGILTPIEHPTYACPPCSTRNYSGRWPLSTSSMLLELTSNRVPNDVASGNVQKLMEGSPSLYVIMGDKDEIVPLQSVLDWFDAVPLSSDDGGKMLTVLKGGGHDFFHERLKGNKMKRTAFDHLFEYLNRLAKKDFE
jgi:alpha-beta hydrolase superfamily lysophospholipase